MDEISVLILNEIPQLKDLDTLLRCGICYEYMKTSMITTCSHNYCSLCIRKSLLYKAQCPTCFEEASDNQLRNNRIVDDIIQIFGKLLDEVQSFMREYGKFSEPPKKVNKKPDFLQQSHSLSDSRMKYNTQNNGLVNNVCSNQKDTGAYGKLSECASGPAASSYISKSAVEPSDDSDFVRLQDVTPVKELHQSPDHRRKVIPAMFSPRNKHIVAEKFVPCPVCNVDIPEKNINVHLDACLKRSEIFDQHASPTKAQKRKPQPKLVYSLLHDKKLREMLKQLGLSTHGDRKALISRHQRFTLLYNSENDKLNPRSTADIIKQMEKEEQEEKKLSTSVTIANKFKIDAKTDPELIEQAQQQYLQDNKTSYDKLIQSMRNREAGKKTAVKRKLILGVEENHSEDGNKEAWAQNVSGQKHTERRHVIISDEDDNAVQKEYGLCEPCGRMSPIIENVSDDDSISKDTIYKAGTDEALSPILGRNVVNNSRKEIEECREGELTESITPDMFGKNVSRSNTEKCNSVSPWSKDVERDEESSTGSNQSISILSQRTQETAVESNKKNTAAETGERLSRGGTPKRSNSQHDDPDFEPYSEDTLDCFEISVTCQKKKKKNAGLSSQPSSSRKGRNLRKKAKY